MTVVSYGKRGGRKPAPPKSPPQRSSRLAWFHAILWALYMGVFGSRVVQAQHSWLEAALLVWFAMLGAAVVLGDYMLGLLDGIRRFKHAP